ncbi:MAG: hypothetical protein JRE16_05670 [Deltaproteobacteria bacterium]|jgi:hypothetical protein|nr:hypothetical protein [Deltaproteobacteria bacterium]MBW2476452.1 hypothetical protein [Deltaproteobacteria bacterium]MBW2504042.1 hypothetical protein [Deltaproteobacteria bacterium]MBW2519094.1 hypothetical protein [Deltaproteobacteria bacterium]
MLKRGTLVSGLALLFLVSGSLCSFEIVRIVPFACSADRLSFGLHAEELPASESWKTEFSEITSQTVMAMNLSSEELQSLVERCDKLKPTIETLEETPRKIYSKRLEKAKALFVFVLETRNEQPPKDQ